MFCVSPFLMPAATPLLCCALWLTAHCARAADGNFHLPGLAIGETTASRRSVGEKQAHLTLGNRMLSAIFRHDQAGLRLVSLQDHFNNEALEWSDANLFTIRLKGKELTSSAMRISELPKIIVIPAEKDQVNLAGRSPGKAVTAAFRDEASGIEVHWTASLRDDSNYIRQEMSVRSSAAIEVNEIGMIDTPLPGARLAGYTDGSPVACGNWFLGMEHPMAKTAVNNTAGWTPADMEANQITRPIKDLQAGPCVIRFDYKSGNHGIYIRKVAFAADGKVLSEDAHDGFSGHQSRQNEYTVQIPANTARGVLQVTLANQAGQFDGSGAISATNGTLASGNVTAVLPRRFNLDAGAVWTLSTHIGVAPAGQFRRAFAYYIQRERAHPYRQYWHYNSWYDLNINRNDLDDPLKRMNEAQCLDVIKAFDANLYQKHGTGLNGFVWDDGWDDWNTLWQFHKGFPDGFTKLNKAARNQGAGMGAWLSPWGGYGRSKTMRVEYGRKRGYETNGGGFSLGGAKYRAAFRDTCLGMIRDYQQGYFKFDGIGAGTWATGAPPSISADLDGLVSITQDLRRANPDVFINCTVGTWASPYWTRFADSIWRQGEDTAFAGKGNPREQWINYKDGVVHRRFASPCPLFPINSLMYHGLVVGPVANPGKMPSPAQDIASFQHEVRMMAGYASGLGELYVTPSLMTDEAWTMLAECIRWSRANQRLLGDSHWIGGDPEKNEIYGFAAWHPEDGGVLTLRNPDDKSRSITLDLVTVWELPGDAGGEVVLHSPWKADADKPAVSAAIKQPLTLTLQPFEVITLQTAR